MIKRTLYFGNPSFLSLRNNQLLVRLPAIEDNPDLPEDFQKKAVATIPIEDIGILILDNQQVTITQAVLSALQENNTAVIICGKTHHPNGLLLPLDVHNIQHERFTFQIESSLPLKKQLWQQTVRCKILNQSSLLDQVGVDTLYMKGLAESIKSGDTGNNEAKAALYYWNHLFPFGLMFSRKREGDPPNNLLNYGYAILRAITARCLVGSGLLPTLGIHHSNKYNAYCLADDIMEPYRPFVDKVVRTIVLSGEPIDELSTELKKKLLVIPTITINMLGEKSVLEVAMHRTTSSLAHCFTGDVKKIIYPEF